MVKNYFKLINRLAIVILLVVTIWSYYSKYNYRTVDLIHPDVLKEPIQTKSLNTQPVIFDKDGYHFKLTPLYDYELNALIVNQLDYRRWFNLSKYESIFPMDLLVIWGDNVKSKVYQSYNLSFSQDMRQGRWRYSGNLVFNNNQVANEHLLINSPELENKLKDISTADQVKIRGQLVNVKAENTQKPDIENPKSLLFNTSTKRNDEGPGACEIIYVSEIIILQKGHPFINSLFKVSFYLLIFLVMGNICWFVYGLFKN